MLKILINLIIFKLLNLLIPNQDYKINLHIKFKISKFILHIKIKSSSYNNKLLYLIYRISHANNIMEKLQQFRQPLKEIILLIRLIIIIIIIFLKRFKF